MAATSAPSTAGNTAPKKAKSPLTPISSKEQSTSKKSDVKTKIFVLDTCVLLFDHTALTNFEENKVALPITVLEELDRFKVGNETKHFEARACIRILDKLSDANTLQDWIPLDNGLGGELKIVMDSGCKDANTTDVFTERTNDHKILDAALCLQANEPDSKVILVSKDINLRLKAKRYNN